MRHDLTRFLLIVAFFASACASSESTQDKPSEDVGISFPDAGDDTDNNVVENNATNNSTAPELEVVRPGSRKTFLIEGTLLLPTGPTQGQLLVSEGMINCISADCSGDPDAQNATILRTTGVVSPGLIDAHNHLPYNFLPEWNPGQRRFNNRYEWADDPSYEAHVAPYANNRSSATHFCPAARWGEVRSVMHGTTTIQGQSLSQSCIVGMARNADHEHDLQYDHLRTTITSVRDITDDEAASYISSFDAMVEPVTRFAVHMAEGYRNDNIELEFSSFAGRDTRANRHQGVSLLHKGTSILIHSIALTAEELDEVKATDSKIVWSPSSNIALYGRTLDIEGVLSRGITTGIGPDWTVSGEDDMLAELRYIREYARLKGLEDKLTPRVLFNMATRDGAEVLGVSEFVGSLEVGKHADITIFRKRTDAYESVVDARGTDVLLVLIGGQTYYGPGPMKGSLSRNDFCDELDVCGQPRFICAADAVTDNWSTVPQMRDALVAILEGTGYPADEQYNRGEDLLDLVACP